MILPVLLYFIAKDQHDLNLFVNKLMYSFSNKILKLRLYCNALPLSPNDGWKNTLGRVISLRTSLSILL